MSTTKVMGCVKFVKGDLFKHVHLTDRIVIAHGCSAQGVMGSGFAKTFKMWFYQDYLLYKKICRDFNYSKELLGNIVINYGNLFGVGPNNNLNCTPITAITQQFYGRDPGVRYVDYDAYETALNEIMIYSLATDRVVHMPLIGAGLGGGDPTKLEGILLDMANSYRVSVTAYSF